MSLFWLKKFVSFWLMPVPFCLTLLVIGTCYLFSPRLNRLGRRLVAMGSLLLLLFANKFVSTALIQPLEQRYPAVPEYAAGAPLPRRLAECRYIVVLGGGHGDVAALSATNKLSSSGLARLVEGVRLARLLPQAQLVVSGPGGAPGLPSHASVLAQAAVSLGLDRSRIILIDQAHDTEDESHAAKAIVGSAPTALVTSAWHMRRAVGLFRHAGVAVLPCPADYLSKTSGYFRWIDLSWDAESLTRSSCAVSENIGYLWVWLRGKV
jgi:uncharacterized SAM-binding protein YcdF (DUF218 family)